MRSEKGDDGVWDALMENTTLVGEVYEIQPCIPRTTKRQEHHSNVEAIRVTLYWKRRSVFSLY